MVKVIKEYVPFVEWIIEVAEEKIIEHRLLQKKFKSHEEFIIFTIIWMRVYKSIHNSIKNDQINLGIDTFIKNFYNNQKNQYLGMTINAITRESKIPRSTVKRIIENLINKKLVARNNNRLIIPTANVRDYMKNYRQFIFRSNKKLNKLFNNLDLENFNEEKKVFM